MIKLKSLLKEDPDIIQIDDDKTILMEDASYTFMVYSDIIDKVDLWIAFNYNSGKIICQSREIEEKIYNENNPIDGPINTKLHEIINWPNHKNIIGLLYYLNRIKSNDFYDYKHITCRGRLFFYNRQYYFTFWTDGIGRNKIIKYESNISDFLKRSSINTKNVFVEIGDESPSKFMLYSEYFNKGNQTPDPTEYDKKLQKIKQDLHVNKGVLDAAILNVLQSKPKNKNDLYAKLEKEFDMPITKIKYIFNDFPLDQLISKKIQELYNL